jgi:hypothetical protein
MKRAGVPETEADKATREGRVLELKPKEEKIPDTSTWEGLGEFLEQGWYRRPPFYYEERSGWNG